MSNFKISFCIIFLLSQFVMAQTNELQKPLLDSAAKASEKKSDAVKKSTDKKKVNLDFDDEVIKGDNNVPELLLMNSRKLVKYKNLFNKRTNYINEIEANKGLFNDYQK